MHESWIQSLSFLSCEMGIITNPALQHYRENEINQHMKTPQTLANIVVIIIIPILKNAYIN